MKPFLAALDDRVLVCDGAMGTMLYGKGVFINRCFESLNQTQPALVTDVHGEYLRAGADVIETNTFGANRMKLRSFGLGDQVRDINLAGARLAREAVTKSGQEAYVAGAIGPLGVRIEPWGKTGVDEAEAMFRDQAQALLDGGVDVFVLETFRDLNEIGAAIKAVRSICDLPIVAQMTTEEEGASLDGTPAEKFAPELIALGANVVGVNCSVGPAPMLETIERISEVTDVWLSAQPNAGKPRDIEGRNLYLCSPEYMASYARRFIASGVRLVGGCCGTTPEHIRQIALAAKQMAPGLARHAAGGDVRTPVGSQPNARRPIDREQKSAMARKLVNGHFLRAIELVPPRGHEAARALEQAATLAERGVDVVTIPDGPRSGARMSALSLAVLVQQHAGAEVLLQYSCRDRNLLGIQSDLLGAHAMGAAEFARHHRRRPQSRRHPGCHGGVRRRFDRVDQRDQPPESRARHWRPVDRRADVLSYGRDGQPITGSGSGTAASRVQSRGGCGIRGDEAGVRCGRVRALPRARGTDAAADRRWDLAV